MGLMLLAVGFAGFFTYEFISLFQKEGLVVNINAEFLTFLGCLTLLLQLAPVMMGSQFIALYFVFNLTAAFDAFVNGNSSRVFTLAKKDESKGLLLTDVKQVRLLLNLRNEINDVLSPFIILLTLCGFSTAVIHGFISDSIFIVGFSPLRMYAMGQSLCLMTTFLMLLYQLFSAGQKLEDEMAKAREKLLVEWEENVKLAFVCQDLRNGTLFPGKYFPLNNSGFIAALGIILTYLIVLLQFRITDYENQH